MPEDIDNELEEFVLDVGPVASMVTELLMTSSVSNWISIVEESQLVIYRVHSLPVASWSTGERLLWTFVMSLAGRARIDLQSFTSYFRHSDLREQIGAVLMASLNR